MGKIKTLNTKKPDYVVLVNKYSIIIIEYDENSSHEKSRTRLNEIKEMFHLNVKEEIRNMESYTTSSTSIESSVSSSSSSTSSASKTQNLLKTYISFELMDEMMIMRNAFVSNEKEKKQNLIILT